MWIDDRFALHYIKCRTAVPIRKRFVFRGTRMSVKPLKRIIFYSNNNIILVTIIYR